MRPIFATLLFCAAPALAAPAVDVLLPPGSSIVFGVRANRILELISQQEGAKDLRLQAKALLAMTPWAGFDPFSDVDELVLATTGTGQNPPALIVITGRFSAAKLGSKGHTYRNVYVTDDPKSKNSTAILDESTLLTGDWPLVKGAIDRYSSSVASAGPLAARIEDLRAKYDVWAFADHLDATAMPKEAAEQLHSIDRFWFGAAISKGVDLTAEVHTTDPKEAEKLSAMIKGFESMARMQMKDQAEGVKLDVQSAEGNIRLSMSIPEEQLKKAMQMRNQPNATSASANVSPVSNGARLISTRPTIVNTEPVITRDSQGNTLTVTLPGPKR
jgi:hypothetical protein